MRILSREINLNETVHLSLDIAKLHTRTSIDVPIIISRGKEDGPCLLLVGGVHGDEVNGVEIVRQIVSNKFNKPEKGTIICIPLLNVFGFLNQQREFPDGRDLNRVFPGSKGGSLASRFAYHVMKEIVPHIDYCIDYHTGGAKRYNYTHLRIDSSDQKTLELAKVFDAPYIMLAPNRDKSFRQSMVHQGKKVLLFEGGKSLHLDKVVTKIGIQGAINVIHHLGMRDFSKQLFPQKHAPIVIKRSTWIRAKHSGMYRSYVSVGQKIEVGTKLGSVSDPFGAFEKTIISKESGYIINSNHSPIVNQGDALFHLAFEN